MPTPGEIRSYLIGVWFLVHLDPQGFRYLDVSERGAARSFWAIVWCTPATTVSWIWLRAAYLKAMPPDSGTGLAFFLRLGMVEAANWITPPVLAGLLCLVLGLGARFLAIVVVMNWLTLPFSYAYAAIIAGIIFIPGSEGIASLLWLALMIALVFMLTRLLRMIIGAQPLMITALVLIILVPNMLLSDALQQYLRISRF